MIKLSVFSKYFKKIVKEFKEQEQLFEIQSEPIIRLTGNVIKINQQFEDPYIKIRNYYKSQAIVAFWPQGLETLPKEFEVLCSHNQQAIKLNANELIRAYFDFHSIYQQADEIFVSLIVPSKSEDSFLQTLRVAGWQVEKELQNAKSLAFNQGLILD